MDELQVTWGKATQVWWSLAWRGVLFGVLSGTATGFLVSLILGATTQPATAQAAAQLAAGLVGIPIGIWVVKTVLQKEYRYYRIALLPSHEAVLEASVRNDADA